MSAVLLFAALAWALNRTDRSALPAATIATSSTTTTETQTLVAEQPTLVADAPAAPAYPPPYPPPPTYILPTPEPTPRPEDPLGVKVCGHGPAPDNISFWAEFADVIVVGTVAEVQPPRWTTPDGSRPANPRTDKHGIYTPVVVEVEAYLKGQQPEQQLWVQASGGQIEQDSVDMCGDPRYTFFEGERVVLFLDTDSFHTQSYEGVPQFRVAEHYTVAADDEATTGASRFNGTLNAPLPKVLADIEAALQP